MDVSFASAFTVILNDYAVLSVPSSKGVRDIYFMELAKE
jgi:hypothetical protein